MAKVADGIGSAAAGLGEPWMDLLWRQYQLTGAYIDWVSISPEPLDWSDWLETPRGRDAAVRARLHEFTRLLTAAQRQREADLEQLRREAALKREARQRPQTSFIVNVSAMSDPNECPWRNFARRIKQAHGVPWHDKRTKGGALWIECLDGAGVVAEQLRASGFSFRVGKGWWRK